MASIECPRCPVLEAEVDSLRNALASRDVIGQAKGLVMATTGCDADEAFRVLVEQSQYENRKVRDIAAELVVRPRTGTGALVYEPIRIDAESTRRLGNDLTAAVSSQGGRATLILTGEGDFCAADALADCLARLVETYDTVVIDLAGLTFADSRFVTTLHRTRLGHPAGTFRLRNPSPMFRRISEIFELGASNVT